MSENLPERTVERLSEYRRMLLRNISSGNSQKTHIYSHELASLHGITAVQVRRDLMLIGFSSDTKKGYNIKELIDFIANILEPKETTNVAVIGMGNMAKALTSYFNGKRTKLKISASFDIDPEKVGAIISGVHCYDIKQLVEVVKMKDVKVLILTLPSLQVAPIIEDIVASGVKGILNFTACSLNFGKDVDIFVQDYDIITLLEKIAYFTKDKNEDI
ncbi:MAG: redox-sensing transcriptional repressor Rex [Rikenellaceae bacterium]